MNIENYIIDFESMHWEEPQPGIRFKAFIQDQTKIRIVVFTEKFVETDWCLNSHVGYVIEGEMEVEFEGEVRTFKAGDSFFIPKGKKNKHRHYSTIKETTIFMVEDA